MKFLAVLFTVIKNEAPRSIKNLKYLDKFCMDVNSKFYHKLKQYSETPTFSRIKPFNWKPCKVEGHCTMLNCLLTPISNESYVDLLQNNEANVPYKTNGSKIWKEIGKITTQTKLLTVLFSGLKFSINTHICALYVKHPYGYFSNPRLFKKTYSDNDKLNFLLTFLLVRESLRQVHDAKAHTIELLEDSGDDHPEKVYIVKLLSDLNDKYPRITVKIKTYNLIMKQLNEIIDVLACLSCEKCKLWGRIQIEGFVTTLKILQGETLCYDEFVCLINLYRRLSESVVQHKNLLNARYGLLYHFLYYWQYVVSAFVTLVIIMAVNKLRIYCTI